jgi:hypothetical protein
MTADEVQLQCRRGMGRQRAERNGSNVKRWVVGMRERAGRQGWADVAQSKRGCKLESTIQSVPRIALTCSQRS